jgi:hypothetical protein
MLRRPNYRRHRMLLRSANLNIGADFQNNADAGVTAGF